jgi:hypothetical protein
MGRTPESPKPEERSLKAILPPEVEFIAYAEDSVVTGYIRLDAARLTDLLNDHGEFELVGVRVESLGGDRSLEVQDVVVARDELLLVQALGPRGERERRIRTRQHPIAMQLGPYHVRGYLHALPGVDPIASFRHRKLMVPLTDAWVEFDMGGVQQQRRAGTLLVNRQQVDWVVEADEAEVDMPDLPVEPAKGPLVKDFTGDIVGRL